MKVSTENDNNFGYEKITIVTVVDNIPLNVFIKCSPTVFVSSPSQILSFLCYLAQ